MSKPASLRQGPHRRHDKEQRGDDMKDVKVLVRVNVGVDAASAILWLASATIALLMYRQHRRDRLASNGP